MKVAIVDYGFGNIGSVRRALEQLQAQVNQLVLDGKNQNEIAEALDLSIPAVKSRLHRARLELLAAMRQWA